MQYFSHDTQAASDDRIRVLRFEAGGAAVDAYWCLLERLYREERPFDRDRQGVDFRALAVTLCAQADQLDTWLDAMVGVGLVEADGALLSSPRATEAINEYRERLGRDAENGRRGGRPRRGRRQTPGEGYDADGQCADQKTADNPPASETKPVDNPPVFEAEPEETPRFPKQNPPVLKTKPVDNPPVLKTNPGVCEEKPTPNPPLCKPKGNREVKVKGKEEPSKGEGSSPRAPANAGDEATRGPGFSPPGVGQVAEYAAANGMMGFPAETFVAYYAARGWLQADRHPPTNWQGLARAWHAREPAMSQGRARPQEVSADDYAQYR